MADATLDLLACASGDSIMNITTKLLIATLTTTPAADGVRDLCDVVHRKTGSPTICKPHKEGAPIYDAQVCCSGSSCFPAPRGRCGSDERLYYCGLGEQVSTGEVDCYFEVPDYCDVHRCPSQIAPHPWGAVVCCQYNWCLEVTVYWPHACAPDDLYFCASLVSNVDGSVTCVDNE
ncbi:MAG: hypothetical protein R6X02_20130 [Enhygromyxa sp.]